MLYTVDTYDASCRGLVNKTGAIVVSPEYRRAPEHVFPASHDDVLFTYRWLRDNAGRLGGDPDRDVLRSQGEGHLEAAGVPVTSTRYDGVMHEFFGAAAVLDKAEQAQQQAAEHLKRGFHRIGVPVAGA